MRKGKVEDKAKNAKGVEENVMAAMKSVERKGEAGQRDSGTAGERQKRNEEARISGRGRRGVADDGTQNGWRCNRGPG